MRVQVTAPSHRTQRVFVDMNKDESIQLVKDIDNIQNNAIALNFNDDYPVLSELLAKLGGE